MGRGKKKTLFHGGLARCRQAARRFRAAAVCGLGIGFTLGLGLVAGYLTWCYTTLPDISSLNHYRSFQASCLYSRDNHLLTEFYLERRNYISPDQIPDHVRRAFVAVEDRRFYHHAGIDPVRIVGALCANLRCGSLAQGGSTITQQLSKMFFLTPEKTLTRKIREIFLALQIERGHSKNEILGLYLNHAYLGSRAYGIGAAAHTYFGKRPAELTIAEAALLAMLPKAPSRYSPFENPRVALQRRNRVLEKMYAAGYINQLQYRAAAATPLPAQYHGRTYQAPYFVDYLRPELERQFGDRLYAAGLKIYTTLDYRLQQAAESAVRHGVEQFALRGITGVEAALTAVDVQTGQVRAMVGGVDYARSQFNRATQALRQPGSAFKPVVYACALRNGFSPQDIIDDGRLHDLQTEGIWVPQNYDGVYHGRVSLERALGSSLNAATVDLARRVGIIGIVQTARDLGIRSTVRPFYSSALGASEMTLLELVCAYATCATGNRIRPGAIGRVIDRTQMAVIEPPCSRKPVLPADIVSDLRHMLRSAVVRGTGQGAAVLEQPVYGKTGTTNDCVDAWFVGFDETMAVGVWVGRDNHQSIGAGETGASAALPIWVDFMQQAGRPGVRDATHIAAR